MLIPTAAPIIKPRLLGIAVYRPYMNTCNHVPNLKTHHVTYVQTITPTIDGLLKDGIFLSDYYTFKICSPSRAAMTTGRYPWGAGFYDMYAFLLPAGPCWVPRGPCWASPPLISYSYTVAVSSRGWLLYTDVRHSGGRVIMQVFRLGPLHD